MDAYGGMGSGSGSCVTNFINNWLKDKNELKFWNNKEFQNYDKL
jgi:hypothetical protein